MGRRTTALTMTAVLAAQAPVAAGASPTLALDRATSALQQASEQHLQAIAYRIDQSARGSNKAMDLRRLTMALDRQSVPLGALRPPPPMREAWPSWFTAWADGAVEWLGGAARTNGLTAGADAEVGTGTRLGVAAGHVNQPTFNDGVETRATSISGYGVVAWQGFAADLTVGAGEAHQIVEPDSDGAAPQEARGGFLFGSVGTRWTRRLAPNVKLMPDARLAVARASAAGEGSRSAWRPRQGLTVINGALGITLDMVRTLEVGTMDLFTAASYRAPLSEACHCTPAERPLFKLRFGSMAPATGRTSLRFGATLTQRNGMVWTLDHTTQPRSGRVDSHIFRFGMRVKF
jgi:hypothetical protein